jgi:hypothetical protein
MFIVPAGELQNLVRLLSEMVERRLRPKGAAVGQEEAVAINISLLAERKQDVFNLEATA